MYFGFGMLSGSIIGGWLQANYGERATVLVSAAGTVINLIITTMAIPKSTKIFIDNPKTGPRKGC